METKAFIQELEHSLDSLAHRCREAAKSARPIRDKIMLETASEILNGLNRAFQESETMSYAEEEDEHIISPKSSEPWD
jgi:hypothetical protein